MKVAILLACWKTSFTLPHSLIWLAPPDRGLRVRADTTEAKKIVFLLLNSLALLDFWWKVAMIIKTIRTPPVNKRESIKAIHDNPVPTPSLKNINIETISRIIASQMGVWDIFAETLNKKINSLIFLSLIKTSILDIENLGKIGASSSFLPNFFEHSVYVFPCKIDDSNLSWGFVSCCYLSFFGFWSKKKI